MTEDQPPPPDSSQADITARVQQAAANSWEWSRLTIAPAVLTGAASLITLLAVSLLLRLLPVDQAGQFALLISISEIIGRLGVHGFTTVITRRYSLSQDHAFNWRSDLLATMAFALPIIALSLLVIQAIYQVSLFDIGYILLSGLLRVGLNTFIYMLNSKEQYTRSALLLRLPNTLLIIPALLVWFAPGYSNLEIVLSIHVINFLVLLLGSVKLYGHILGEGRQRISFLERKQGVIFLLSSATMLLPDQGLLVIGGALLSPPELAAFAAVIILIRPFKLIRGVLGMVLMPEFIRREAAEYRSLLLGLLVLAGMIALFIGVVSPSIFVWFYPDRYQQALPAIPFLAGAGFMHLLSVIPRSYLVGRGSTSFINRMVLTEGTGLVLALSVGLIGAYFIGTQGLAVGLVFVEAVRLIISILYWRSLRSLELKSR